jgi:hypothetical protein
VRTCLILNTVFSSVVSLLCLSATLGIPIRHVSWLIVAVCLLSLVAVGTRIRAKFRIAGILIVLLVSAVIVTAIGLKSFQGCFPGITADSWTYAALGQYLRDYPRNTNAILAVIDQFSAYVSETRFGADSLLAFLSASLHINTARAFVPLLVIVFLNGITGFYVLTRLLGSNKTIALASGVFFALCGWTSDALTIGNLDNLVFLSLSPFFLARLLLFGKGCRDWSFTAALTVNAAAFFYSYAEGFIITSLLISPFLVSVVFRTWKSEGQFPVRLSTSLVATLFIVAPYIPTWIRFLSSQWSVETSASRAGEGIFPGLLGPGFLPALFGLGEEFSKVSPQLHSTLIAFVAVALCIAGVFLVTSWRVARAIALLGALALGALQGIVLRYDYGLYKVIFLSAVIWLPAMFQGVFGIVLKLHCNRTLASAVSCLLLLLCFFEDRFGNRQAIPYQGRKKIASYEQIQQLDRIVKRAPVLIDCQNDFEYEWGLFFARKLNAQILNYKSYLQLFHERDLYGKGYLLPKIDAERVPAYILSDYPRSESIWSNRVFWLSRVDSAPSILSVDCPNGIETFQGGKLIWIGNQPTKFFISAEQDMSANLYSKEIVMGPSVSSSRSRTICVKLRNSLQELRVEKNFAASLQLRRGINEVEVWCKDKCEVSKQPNGDTRVLLLGLLSYQVEAASAATLYRPVYQCVAYNSFSR